VVSIHTGFTLLWTRHGGMSHRPAGPKFQAKASAGMDGVPSPVGARVVPLAQGGIKPDPQLDHLQHLQGTA
jgi:hypothetical protein